MNASSDSHSEMYKALSSERHTRVLQLLASTPDSNESRLLLGLSELNVDDETTTWDCLSYTWGAPIDSPECFEQYGPAHDVPISLQIGEDHYPFTIGRNLYEALRQMWQYNHRTNLWVDAICINQSDLSEKSQQVLLMGEIYSRAERVIAWVGVDDPLHPTFDDIVWLHTTVVDKIKEYQESQNQQITCRDWIPADTKSMQGLYNHKIDVIVSWSVLRALMHFNGYRRYFTRSWIVQELCLAKRDPFFFLDKWTITLDSMCCLQATLYGHPTLPTLAHRDLGNGASHHHSETMWISAMREKLHALRDNGETGRFLLDGLFAIDRGPHAELKATYFAIWEELLCTLFRRQASDPRDLIYSLIGLVTCSSNHRQNWVHPDYNISTEELFVSFTAEVLENSPRHHILSLAYMPSDDVGERRTRVPSWVPDYEDCEVQSKTIQEIHTLNMGFPADFSPTGAAPRGDSLFKTLLAVLQSVPGFEEDPEPAGDEHQILIDGRELSAYGRHSGTVTKTSKLIGKVSRDSDGGKGLLANGDADMLQALVTALTVCVSEGPIYRPSGEDMVEAVFRLLADIPRSTLSVGQKIHDTLCNAISDIHIQGLATTSASAKLKFRLSKLQGRPGIPNQTDLDKFQQWGEALHEHSLALFAGSHFTAEEKNLMEQVATNRLNFFAAHDYNLFVTSGGYIGKTIGAVKEGDELWLLCSVNVPFLLRPAGEGKFRIVGECLVHGAMYGEMVERRHAGEVRQIRIV